MTQAKLEAEQALEEKALPLDVVIECLTLREGRQSIDVVRDDVEAELKKVRILCFCVSMSAEALVQLEPVITQHLNINYNARKFVGCI